MWCWRCGRKENAGRPVSRVLYPPPSLRRRRTVAIYLAPMRCNPHRPVGRGSVATGVKRSTRGRAGRPWSLYLALLQVGFGRRCVAALGRTLLPPDFTLADQPKTGRRYVSVPLSVPGSVSRAGAWALPSTLSGGARTFLPEAIAVSDHRSRRPPGRPGFLLA